jgi:hypothetical protein
LSLEQGLTIPELTKIIYEDNLKNSNNDNLQTIELTNDQKRDIEENSNNILNNIYEILNNNFSNIGRYLNVQDLNDIPIKTLDNYDQILNKLDNINFDSLKDDNIRSKSSELEDPELENTANKIANTWKDLRDPIKFASKLIDAGLDPNKI